MLILENQILDLSETESFALKFCKDLKVGDVLLLKGELGVGKTTFSRFIINNLHTLNKNKKPSSINSPTYPILLTYDLSAYEIYHYDFYRVSKSTELVHLNIFEELNNSITLVEWPGIILDSLQNYKYFTIHFDLLDENRRYLTHNLIFN